MGQRHQVYVFTHDNKEPNKILCKAFHNQWSYGSLPLRHVKRVAMFQKRADEFTRFSSTHNYSNSTNPDILKSCERVGCNKAANHFERRRNMRGYTCSSALTAIREILYHPNKGDVELVAEIKSLLREIEDAAEGHTFECAANNGESGSTNTGILKLVDELEQLIGHANFDSADNLLRVIGIINKLRAGA